jgi:hypothetical protein
MEQSAAKSRLVSGERRSRRVLLRVPIVVRGCHANGTPFREHTQTLVVSENSALILLATSIERGQAVRLMHRATGQEQDCTVVYVGPKQGDKKEIGIEFKQTAHQFWQIDFPAKGYKPQTG